MLNLRWSQRTVRSELPLTTEVIHGFLLFASGTVADLPVRARGQGIDAHRRRVPPRVRRPRRGILLHQRHRDRRPQDAAGEAHHQGRGHRLRPAPGQRHRPDIPRRPLRLHLLHPPGASLPGQGAVRPRHRAGRRDRRRRLHRATAAGRAADTRTAQTRTRRLRRRCRPVQATTSSAPCA